MSDQLSMFGPRMSEASPSVTSSPASADGVSRSDSLAGPMLEPCGPAVAPVSPSRQRAPKLGATIRATFGRRGFASSASAALQQSLVSRLRQQLDMDGSILFAMTWKEKGTPSGRSVSQVQCRARSTSGSGYGSWPSPRVSDESAGRILDDQGRRVSKSGVYGANLSDLVTLANWPTPQVSDSLGGGSETEARQKAQGERRPSGAVVGRKLRNSVLLASWATPTSRDHKDGASEGSAPVNALLGRQVWEASGADAVWLPCRDGKARPVKPGIFPLVAGLRNRVGLLRGAGNAIKPQVAQVFIEAYLSLEQ